MATPMWITPMLGEYGILEGLIGSTGLGISLIYISKNLEG
jgi:hypothetical protein